MFKTLAILLHELHGECCYRKLPGFRTFGIVEHKLGYELEQSLNYLLASRMLVNIWLVFVWGFLLGVGVGWTSRASVVGLSLSVALGGEGGSFATVIVRAGQQVLIQ